ncbi:hypothetical protein Glove_74g104 [Diversispora epigaea]|uniref:RRM domain-containing protein n=1 Tax=Diversispora epigaea TaxID=1348612 RepID=A0A397J8Y3_9GLOM|nr:hypothetical protein Glove_74g104 [Diversispora epigaea]
MTYCENCKVLKGLRNENKNLIDEIANKITQVDQEYSNTQEEIRKLQIEIRDIRLDKLQNEPLPPLPEEPFPSYPYTSSPSSPPPTPPPTTTSLSTITTLTTTSSSSTSTTKKTSSNDYSKEADKIIPIIRNLPKKPQVPRPTKTYHPQVPPAFFGNIPNNVSENDLRAEIEKKFGKILAISLFRGEETAIVNFADMESYFEAIETRVFGFRRINLSIKQ